MSHKRQYQATVSGEWARHLRPYGKRAFWKGERRAQGEQAAQEVIATFREYDQHAMPTKVQALISEAGTAEEARSSMQYLASGHLTDPSGELVSVTPGRSFNRTR